MLHASAALESASAEAAELEVRRAAAERQSSHLAARLRLESAAHSTLTSEYQELSRMSAAANAELAELRTDRETLQQALTAERKRSAALESTIATLRDEALHLRHALAQAEAAATVNAHAERATGLAEHAVSAEAARGRELTSRLELALKEAREREAAANARADLAVGSASAQAERRARALRLQLEQVRDAAAARDREAAEARQQQLTSERAARTSTEAEANARARLADLEKRCDEWRAELHEATAERDALSAKAEQLGQLADAQGVELRRLQAGKARAKAAAVALRRQLSQERQAHGAAAAQAAQQLRAQAEAAAVAAQNARSQARHARQHFADGGHEAILSGDRLMRRSPAYALEYARRGYQWDDSPLLPGAMANGAASGVAATALAAGAAAAATPSMTPSNGPAAGHLAAALAAALTAADGAAERPRSSRAGSSLRASLSRVRDSRAGLHTARVRGRASGRAGGASSDGSATTSADGTGSDDDGLVTRTEWREVAGEVRGQVGSATAAVTPHRASRHSHHPPPSQGGPPHIAHSKDGYSPSRREPPSRHPPGTPDTQAAPAEVRATQATDGRERTRWEGVSPPAAVAAAAAYSSTGEVDGQGAATVDAAAPLHTLASRLKSEARSLSELLRAGAEGYDSAEAEEGISDEDLQLSADPVACAIADATHRRYSDTG